MQNNFISRTTFCSATTTLAAARASWVIPAPPSSSTARRSSASLPASGSCCWWRRPSSCWPPPASCAASASCWRSWTVEEGRPRRLEMEWKRGAGASPKGPEAEGGEGRATKSCPTPPPRPTRVLPGVTVGIGVPPRGPFASQEEEEETEWRQMPEGGTNLLACPTVVTPIVTRPYK